MHIYLRSKINVILAKRNIVVVLRRKPDAMTMLPMFQDKQNEIVQLKLVSWFLEALCRCSK